MSDTKTNKLNDLAYRADNPVHKKYAKFIVRYRDVDFSKLKTVKVTAARMQELSAKSAALTDEQTALRKQTTRAAAEGSTDSEAIRRIGDIDVELQSIAAAVDLLGQHARKLDVTEFEAAKGERIKAKLKAFDDKVKRLRETYAKRLDTLEDVAIARRKGEEVPDPFPKTEPKQSPAERVITALDAFK